MVRRKPRLFKYIVYFSVVDRIHRNYIYRELCKSWACEAESSLEAAHKFNEAMNKDNKFSIRRVKQRRDL